MPRHARHAVPRHAAPRRATPPHPMQRRAVPMQRRAVPRHAVPREDYSDVIKAATGSHVAAVRKDVVAALGRFRSTARLSPPPLGESVRQTPLGDASPRIPGETLWEILWEILSGRLLRGDSMRDPPPGEAAWDMVRGPL